MSGSFIRWRHSAVSRPLTEAVVYGLILLARTVGRRAMVLATTACLTFQTKDEDLRRSLRHINHHANEFMYGNKPWPRMPPIAALLLPI